VLGFSSPLDEFEHPNGLEWQMVSLSGCRLQFYGSVRWNPDARRPERRSLCLTVDELIFERGKGRGGAILNLQHLKGHSLKAFVIDFFKPSVQRIVRRALALRPRGAIPNDVLVLNSLRLSAPRLQLEWRARDIHPWDRDLLPTRQAELFSKQALQDTDVALIRLFQSLPEIEEIEFQVLNPADCGGVILTGVVDREQALDPEPPLSLRMRLNMLGVHYQMAEDHLVLLPTNSWAPMLGKRLI
jgi:hypothetical protein